MIGKTILWAGALFLAGASLSSAARGEASFAERRDATFDAVWEQVGRTYYDAAFGGKDWSRVGERYRRRLDRIQDTDALRDLLRKMLFELGDSHLGILASGYEESGVERPWRGGWAGVELCYAGRNLVVFRLEETGAGFAAGLRRGDRIERVGGSKVGQLRRQLRRTGLPDHLLAFSTLQAALSRFRGSPDEEVEVWARSPGGECRALQVTLEAYEGRVTQRLGNIGAMPLAFESRRLDGGVAYLHFSLWFPAVMGDIREAIGELGAETPGLVIDLRGNPGGVGLMAGGLAGLLVDEETPLGTTTLREGHINFVGFPQRGGYSGRVAILVDESSLSTSEIFAAGMQRAGRARVFGQPTPGAALPSIVTSLPNGDFLQVALGDFRTSDGLSLEGRGVSPDEIVRISPVELSRGNDTVLHAALQWIHNAP